MKDERKFMKHERCKCEQNMEAAKELLLSGNFEAAIPHYDRAIAACGNHMAWSNKGICLDELGKMDEALVCYENSIKEEPGYAFAWNNKGTNLARQQQFDMALECFTRAVDIDPSYLQAKINKKIGLVWVGYTRSSSDFFKVYLRKENDGYYPLELTNKIAGYKSNGWGGYPEFTVRNENDANTAIELIKYALVHF
jgi:tetratricopeptide (TPR) repeat protein